MLKRIPKSDISIRPFKAYKEWSFSSGSTQIDVLTANVSSSNLNIFNGGSGSVSEKSLYGELRAQFYNGHEDNPFLRFGDKNNIYETASAARDRFLSGSAKVISIPKIYVGEGIKKCSVVYLDGGTEFVDDSYGNLIASSGDSVNVIQIDIESNYLDFKDLLDVEYIASFQTSIGDIDINAETFNLVYNGISYDIKIISFDSQSGVLIVDNLPFLIGAAGTNKIGNVFYTQGLVVITRNLESLFNSGWSLNYKSTQTIYEHEYLLIAEQDEFNVSQNPSAIISVGGETEMFTDSMGKTTKVYTTQPAKYIRKKSTLENGNIIDYRFSGSVGNSLAGFEHWELSGSVDSTGSFLAPFITTIGLYDDNCDLVAVAKLPQPIKSEHDLTVNFIVRFDT